MKPRPFSNIILIGMPSAGKSTIGVILAKQSARDYLDTDVLMQLAEKKSLQQILDESGYMELRRIEERVLLELDCQESHHCHRRQRGIQRSGHATSESKRNRGLLVRCPGSS